MWWPPTVTGDNSTNHDNGTLAGNIEKHEDILEISNIDTDAYYDDKTATSSYSTENDFNEEGTLERRFFYMYYTTADETELNTEELIDLPTFIGSVGGILGLCFGFSFHGMLFPLFDYAEGAYARWIRKKI